MFPHQAERGRDAVFAQNTDSVCHGCLLIGLSDRIADREQRPGGSAPSGIARAGLYFFFGAVTTKLVTPTPKLLVAGSAAVTTMR
ncbi:MAG: hypothetical protein Kow0054_20660 [Deferrisoma sp.]